MGSVPPGRQSSRREVVEVEVETEVEAVVVVQVQVQVRAGLLCLHSLGWWTSSLLKGSQVLWRFLAQWWSLRSLELRYDMP